MAEVKRYPGRDQRILMQATALKRQSEARDIHRALTAAGIPEDVGDDGVRSCLLARVMVALDRLPPV